MWNYIEEQHCWLCGICLTSFIVPIQLQLTIKHVMLAPGDTGNWSGCPTIRYLYLLTMALSQHVSLPSLSWCNFTSTNSDLLNYIMNQWINVTRFQADVICTCRNVFRVSRKSSRMTLQYMDVFDDEMTIIWNTLNWLGKTFRG